MKFFESILQYRAKQKAKAVSIASLTDEHFFARIEALDTVNCPECKSKIIDEPYQPNKCDNCGWSEDGRVGSPCSVEGCDGDIEQINPTTGFCFSCNSVTYSPLTTEAT